MNSCIKLVMAEPVHINWIANNMREIDRRECLAFGRSPKQALRSALGSSIKSWTALVDGKPHAMFGVVVGSAISGKATPWFLGTDEVYRHGRALLMMGPGMLDRLADSTFTLTNLVSSENKRAIRLLEKWGFEVAVEEEEHGGVPFRRFTKEPRNVPARHRRSRSSSLDRRTIGGRDYGEEPSELPSQGR